MFFSIITLTACDTKEDIEGFDKNHLSDSAQTGAFFNYVNFDFPFEGKERIWAIIYNKQITLAFLGNNWNVFDFNRTGNYYTGYNGVETILFSLKENVLSLRRVKESLNHIDMRFEREVEMISTNNEFIKLDIPINLEYNISGLSWRVDAENIFGLLGAGVEIKRANSQSFEILHPQSRIMADLFIIQFSDLALMQGLNILRVNHIGGPFLSGNEINISINSEAVYVNLTKNLDGSLYVQLGE